jgi:hypothetical protein
VNNRSRQRAIRIYHSDISLYYIVMREYTIEKAFCQYILANIINILVILTDKQQTCQCYGEMNHIIGKYFVMAFFMKLSVIPISPQSQVSRVCWAWARQRSFAALRISLGLLGNHQ